MSFLLSPLGGTFGIHLRVPLMVRSSSITLNENFITLPGQLFIVLVLSMSHGFGSYSSEVLVHISQIQHLWFPYADVCGETMGISAGTSADWQLPN